jgi:hypothetical protein
MGEEENQPNYGMFDPTEDLERIRGDLEGLGVDLSGEKEGNSLSRILSGIGGYLSGGGGQGLAGLGLLLNAYNRLGGIGERGLELGQGLAETQLGQAAFRPYTVTTATGGQFTAGPEGQYTMAMSPEEQAMRNQLMTGATGFYDRATQGTADRTEDIYGRMLTAMQPGMERQRLANEERMAAQGRLGVRSNMFGGMAPEDFELNRAQQEALNNAYLGAMQQARGEQAQQAALGQQYFGASYLPQQQMLAAFQPGQTAAGAAQQAQLYGTGLFGEATASGIDALLASGLGQANLMGEAGTGLLSGLFGARPASSTNPLGFLSNLIPNTGG